MLACISTLARVKCSGHLETKSSQPSLLRSIVYVCHPMGLNNLVLPLLDLMSSSTTSSNLVSTKYEIYKIVYRI